MSEVDIAAQQPEVAAQSVEVPKPESAATTDAANTTGNKRKRDASDQDDAAGEDASSNKRTSPLNVTATTTTTTIITEEEGQAAAASQLDFEALSQQQSGEQAAQSNGEPTAAEASSTAAAALAGIYPTMTVPQPTDLSFAAASGDGDRSNLDPSFNMEGEGDQSFNMENLTGSNSAGTANSKPQVGSEEWHRVRRDNHKEVERRRRETINEGINELAKIVPGCEKNKGSILQRAVAFITQLKENEAQNIEKWTLEKLLTEQAIAELSGSYDKLKEECERAWREAETWKKACQGAGIDVSKANGEASSSTPANVDAAAKATAES